MTNQNGGEPELLNAAYATLDLSAGALFDATNTPTDVSAENWAAKGGWLTLAKRIGAEKIFFVGDNPIAVFVRSSENLGIWRRLFNQAWCMARPPLLFLAQPGELNVFDLTQPPIARGEDCSRQPDRLLETVRQVSEIRQKLKRYHRSEMESGRLFADPRFRLENRADRALIRDLGELREALLGTELSVPHSHSLIGRSIFVRYLEDRGILIEEYFREIAGKRKAWHALLDSATLVDDETDRRLYYPSVLQDKGFTHKLFRRLSRDFNGDLFPFGAEEQDSFTEERLKLVRGLLTGEMRQKRLFFFAYDFKIIPLELISSMYEEFLKAEKGKTNTQGSFYTPGVLVDFVLSQTLTPQVLEQRPRIMDPACGSAIFLVEAFHRVVRHRRHQLGRRLRPIELRKILREQIAGIDVNPEAIRVASFSLYLALLEYLDPPDILQHKLPKLTYSPRQKPSKTNPPFDILVAGNTFNIKSFVPSVSVRKQFSSNCADVLVGNPPWGKPNQQDEATKQGYQDVLAWCDENKKQVGDGELSQAFVHKSMDLLREGGVCGLLVSTGVFFKRHEKSQTFRRQWLSGTRLEQVVNFAAVRDAFFSGPERKKGSIAPFASVIFVKGEPEESDHRFQYYSAKETGFVQGLQAVVLARPDLHVLSQYRLLQDDELWKVYWWGGHRDEGLLQALRAESTLAELVDPTSEHPERFGEGFKVTKKNRKPATHLGKYKELPIAYFQSYGAFPADKLRDPPSEIERERDETLFHGLRLLIKRGITQKRGTNGRILARLESAPFCYRNSIHCFRLVDVDTATALTVLGIAWSSLTRYYLWLTSGSWGMWHHELKIETLKRLPVRWSLEGATKDRLVSIVEQLRSVDIDPLPLFDESAGTQNANQLTIAELESQLDEAVFDLFELSDGERDLVRDMCDTGLDFFYRGMESKAVKPIPAPIPSRTFGRRADLTCQSGLEGYLDAFLEMWEPELGSSGRFQWRVIRPSNAASMMAVVFRTEETNDPLPPPDDSDDEAWQSVLEDMGDASLEEVGASRIFIDGMTRIVRPHDITIIKRNEQRLWTRSAAREDADATLARAIQEQCSRTGESNR